MQKAHRYALSPPLFLLQRNQTCGLTPDISPEIVAPNLIITPLVLSQAPNPVSLLQEEKLEQFCLECNPKAQRSNKYIQQSVTQNNLNWLENSAEDDLEQIIELTQQKYEDYSMQNHQSLQQQSDEDCLHSWPSESVFSHSLSQDYEKQSATQFVPSSQPSSFDWSVPNAKKQIISKLQSVVESQDIATEDIRRDLLMTEVKSYALESERHYIDECLSNLQGNIQQIFATLCNGIGQTLKRKIGGLLFEKRRVKILKYIEKKKKRTWNRKVSYNCRKKVADGRLRVKGKFVTHKQACQQLALHSQAACD